MTGGDIHVPGSADTRLPAAVGWRLISALGTWLLVLAVPAHVLLVTGSLRNTGLTLARSTCRSCPRPGGGGGGRPVGPAQADDHGQPVPRGAVATMLLGPLPAGTGSLRRAGRREQRRRAVPPGLQARTPAIVGTGTMLTSANSLNALPDGAVRLVGGPLGGMLLAAFGVRALICADVVSYLVSPPPTP